MARRIRDEHMSASEPIAGPPFDVVVCGGGMAGPTLDDGALIRVPVEADGIPGAARVELFALRDDRIARVRPDGSMAPVAEQGR